MFDCKKSQAAGGTTVGHKRKAQYVGEPETSVERVGCLKRTGEETSRLSQQAETGKRALVRYGQTPCYKRSLVCCGLWCTRAHDYRSVRHTSYMSRSVSRFDVPASVLDFRTCSEYMRCWYVPVQPFCCCIFFQLPAVCAPMI